MTDFSRPLAHDKDYRFTSFSWDIHEDPTKPGAVQYIKDGKLVDIPPESEILGPLKFKSSSVK